MPRLCPGTGDKLFLLVSSTKWCPCFRGQFSPLTSLACHVNHINHTQQLLLLKFHLPVWHCPGPSLSSLSLQPYFLPCGVQTLCLVRSFGPQLYWTMVADRTPRETKSLVHRGCVHRLLTHAFPRNASEPGRIWREFRKIIDMRDMVFCPYCSFHLLGGDQLFLACPELSQF